MSTLNRQTKFLSAAAGILGAALLILATAACDHDSDPIAPADSTITVSASPQTVELAADPNDPNTLRGTTRITATVRSKSGTRLPDQEVSFATSAGNLDPPADTPILTDDQGQALSILTTSTNATVTARSGGINGSTQVQTVRGQLQQFILNLDRSTLTSCTQTVKLMAQVNFTSGLPAGGQQVIFDETGLEVVGNFLGGTNKTTDPNGMAETTWQPDSNSCTTKCQDPNGPTQGDCNIFFVADDPTSTFTSVEVRLNDGINQ